MNDLERGPRTAGNRRTTVWHSKLHGRELKAACIGFCLTVLMGTGAGYAAALWNQSSTLTMQATAETLPSPVLTCGQGSNAQTVVVTWAPQRAGVTSYVVTVTRNGTIFTTKTYQPGTTSETITAPPGIINVAYTYTYAVTVIAHYGSWQASPAVQDNIIATKTLLGSPRISCPPS